MTNAEQYAQKYFENAYQAYLTHGVHPLVILAQGANESAYGSSNIARNYNNHFGITKGSSWTGATYTAGTGLVFRAYPSAAESFQDFGRLIASLYPSCAAVSSDLEAYAEAISQSRYIAECNGDNRPLYRDNIIFIGRLMEPYVTEQLQKKKL